VYPGDPTGVKNLLTWVRRQGAAAGSGSAVPEVGGRMLQLLLQQQLGVGFTWPKGRQLAAIFCEYTLAKSFKHQNDNLMLLVTNYEKIYI
jgi:hypothetical protein